ncbi:MAG: hypothetical protein UY27_C0019G0006 [Candidatus Gottesmanbacteria bacterium GW2011_GWA1_48_13]|uniref:Uncharacterized protein n=1 Tax=Candidatus Gottesmanbacteria bacterium GW2011_GWA1_48_13 TaxID=1618439 RepID=A0A0G1UMM2_9BACT|nr:MAG: hypothetical protein UY27_C0019G0006 [Candidatus Gottesmanbacteria bacterium GW2011_GWA1_48_13]
MTGEGGNEMSPANNPGFWALLAGGGILAFFPPVDAGITFVVGVLNLGHAVIGGKETNKDRAAVAAKGTIEVVLGIAKLFVPFVPAAAVAVLLEGTIKTPNSPGSGVLKVRK